MTEKYHQPARVRREQILQAAVALAARDGYLNIKRDDIAERAGVAAGSVNLHFGTMQQLRRDLMRYVVREAGTKPALLRVLAQGLAMKDKHAAKAAHDVKAAALATLQP